LGFLKPLFGEGFRIPKPLIQPIVCPAFGRDFKPPLKGLPELRNF